MRVVPPADIALGPDEARLRIDWFGLTSNNITYAVFGDAMSYWQFFPARPEGGTRWGRVPVWGFADVVESSTPGLAEATRVYGYVPMAAELVVRPGRVDDTGFSDVAAHRDPLPSVYNRYSYVGSDPVYHRDREPQQMLLWPLFVTSFVVDDFLGDHGMFGTSSVVISSASSKTAVAAAYLLCQREGVDVIGLTSTANVGFVESLGCYQHVATYDDVASLPIRDTCYVDVAGRRDVTGSVHGHFGEHLCYSMVVGDTHWDHRPDHEGPLTGPNPTFLFAPDQITRRRREWGRHGFEQRVAAAWNGFAPWTDDWLTIRRTSGPTGVESVYRVLLEGRIDPRVGDLCTLSELPSA